MNITLNFLNMGQLINVVYNPTDFTQNIQNGININAGLTVENRSYLAANPIRLDYQLNDASRINPGTQTVSINSLGTHIYNVSFDFTNMTLSALTGNIFIIDSTFVKDTIARIPVVFTKTILGTVQYSPESQSDYDSQNILKSGVSLSWALSGTDITTVSQLRLENRVNNILDTVYTYDLISDQSIDLMNLQDGAYLAIVRLQDGLAPTVFGSSDTISFNIRSRQIQMERVGFWSLIGSVNRSTGNISGLLDDPNLVYWYWNPNSQEYVKISGSNTGAVANDLKTVDPKRAYWVKLPSGSTTRTMNVNSNQVDTSFSSSENEVSLKSGWNLISNPWNHDISIGNQLVSNSGSFVSAGSIQDSLFRIVSYNVVDSTYTYQTLDSAGNKLEAKRGYWAYTNVDRTFKFRPYLKLNTNNKNKVAWSSDLVFTNKGHKENLEFKSYNDISNDYLSEAAPKLYKKGFEINLNKKYSAVGLPQNGSKDYYRYELELIGNTGDLINIDLNEKQGDSKKYFYLQKPGNKNVIKIDNSEKTSIRLSKKYEKYLVYVSSSKNFEPPYVPDRFTVKQNFPNPFNPITTISFDLPYGKKRFDVNVIVYNLLGQKIKTLFKGKLNSGTRYYYKWDSTNDFGQKVASGIYFYRVVAGSFIQSKKMVLIK